jgi:RNA polymerase sigma-70 factor, ECF subfamily
MDTTPHTLLYRLRHGGQHAQSPDWDRFVELFTPLLYEWAQRLANPSIDAADLVQSVFVVLLRKLPEFDADRSKSFRGWLRTVLVNQARDLYRRRRPELPIDPDRLDALAGPDTSEAVAETEFRRHLIHRVMRLMQQDFAATTWQACWQTQALGRPAADVAAQLGISVAAVYAATHRVLQRLRRDLDGFLASD